MSFGISIWIFFLLRSFVWSHLVNKVCVVLANVYYLNSYKNMYSIRFTLWFKILNECCCSKKWVVEPFSSRVFVYFVWLAFILIFCLYFLSFILCLSGVLSVLWICFTVCIWPLQRFIYYTKRIQCTTFARSLGVRRAGFGSVGEVLKRGRCDFAARSAPGNAFFDGQNRAILLQNHRAARANCRSSGLKGKKSGPFTLLVLMIGAVFRMLPQNSRKIERAKKIVFRRANWGIGIIRTHAWMPKTVGLEICFFWHVR